MRKTDTALWQSFDGLSARSDLKPMYMGMKFNIEDISTDDENLF
jgi:hypothetical protein